MKFPNMVYKCPGPYLRNGGTYDCVQVTSQEQVDALKGWHPTLPEAIAAHDSPVALVTAVTSPTKPKESQPPEDMGVSKEPSPAEGVKQPWKKK
jgi:hypothetical protein